MSAHVIATIALPVMVAAVCIAAALGFHAIGMQRCALASWLAAGVVVVTPIALAIVHQIQQIDWLQVGIAASSLLRALAGG